MSDETPVAEAAASTEVVPATVGPPSTDLAYAKLPSRAQAIEEAKLIAASGLYPSVRDAAKAGVVCLLGLDMGLTPSQAVMNIHPIEDRDGKISFVIESKAMSAMLKRHPRYDFKILKRDAEGAEVQFLVDGAPIDDGLEGKIAFTIKDAETAGLAGPNAKKKAWRTNTRDMLFWRAIAEGVRVYFPDLLAGQPVYVEDADGIGRDEAAVDYMGAIEPPKPVALTDDKAQALKARMKAAFDGLTAIDPTRVPPGLYANMLAKAEHSHDLLEARALHLEDMLAREKEYVEAVEKLDELDLDKTARKQITDRAERRPAAHERVEVVKQAIEAHEEAVEAAGGGDDGAA